MQNKEKHSQVAILGLQHLLAMSPCTQAQSGSNHDCWSFGLLSSSINLLDFN